MMTRPGLGATVNAIASSSRCFSSSSSIRTSVNASTVPSINPENSCLEFPKLKQIKANNGIHVATLHLRAHHPTALDLYSTFAVHTASSLKIPTSLPAVLPTTTTLITVPKSPFVHKKSQENFHVKHHKRVIKVWDTDREVLDLWLRYLRINGIGGVGMKAYIHEFVDFGFGRKDIEGVERALEKGASAGRKEKAMIEKAAESSIKASGGEDSEVKG